MTQFLPPNLLALFAPRDPVPFLPPATKLPHEKKTDGYQGVGTYLHCFEDPKDTPPPTRVETREERVERKRREKAEQVAYKLEQDIALWDPHNNSSSTSDPYKTLFIARINYDTSESKLRREFEVYGPIKKIGLVHDKVSGKPRGYAFIEYEHERDMHSAYKHADGKKIDGRRILVDVERGRTVKGWLPRRLGGGLGGTRRGGPEVNVKHSGREDPRLDERYIEREGRERPERIERNDRGERERGERDRGERERGERDRGERDRGERERGERDRGERGERDRGERERGERDRPERDRAERDRGDREREREPRRRSRSRSKEKRRRSRSRSRERHRRRERSRDRDRGRDRDADKMDGSADAVEIQQAAPERKERERKRSRSRDRDRKRRRSRSRSRDRKRRDRDRDRGDREERTREDRTRGDKEDRVREETTKTEISQDGYSNSSVGYEAGDFGFNSESGQFNNFSTESGFGNYNESFSG